MPRQVALVTGSSGLIGSEMVDYLDVLGWEVHGIDNNMRKDFFGPGGDTTWNLERLKGRCRDFTHWNVDIRSLHHVNDIMWVTKPNLVVHCAAQPAHDLAALRPLDDFSVNATGTLNMLEATRNYATDAVFAFMSTSKVYGDAPNELKMIESETRYECADPRYALGITEDLRIDASMHSIFGASKVAADIMVQEYGRYFGMSTVCFRGGCLTGPNHSPVQLHGFLAYLVKCAKEGIPYKTFGYKGKQVRDNIHSFDVCSAIMEFYEDPKSGAVYNLGGGRPNSISILEAASILDAKYDLKLKGTYEKTPRLGDHIWYVSDTSKFSRDYPNWNVTVPLLEILDQLTKDREWD